MANAGPLGTTNDLEGAADTEPDTDGRRPGTSATRAGLEPSDLVFDLQPEPPSTQTTVGSTTKQQQVFLKLGQDFRTEEQVIVRSA